MDHIMTHCSNAKEEYKIYQMLYSLNKKPVLVAIVWSTNILELDVYWIIEYVALKSENIRNYLCKKK